MPKFRKKPIIIEAVRWDGSWTAWDRILSMGLRDFKPGEMGSNTFSITTLEGDMLVQEGDWVIRGVNNEFYPCKPDIFEKTYEGVSREEDVTVFKQNKEVALRDINDILEAVGRIERQVELIKQGKTKVGETGADRIDVIKESAELIRLIGVRM